jgi:hypothetical protein
MAYHFADARLADFGKKQNLFSQVMARSWMTKKQLGILPRGHIICIQEFHTNFRNALGNNEAEYLVLETRLHYENEINQKDSLMALLAIQILAEIKLCLCSLGVI